MAKLSLRRYDTQAVLSIVAALTSVVALIGLIGVIVRRMDMQEFTVVYGQRTRMAVLGATAVTLMLSAIGFGLGFNSIGQRRNEKQGYSWSGFYISACVLCITLVVFFVFYSRGEMVAPR